MHCIRCDTDMKKTAKAGIVIDACPNCRGLWLDGGELEMLEKGYKKENAELMQEAAREIRSERTKGITIKGMCPNCQDASLRVIRRERVEVDFCPACKGIFFDEGELPLVLEGGSTDSFLDKVAGCFKSILGRG